MTFWQRFAVAGLAIVSMIGVNVIFRAYDPDVRAGVTGFLGMVIGWMMRTPGDGAAFPQIPPPSRVPTFPETPDSKDAA